MKNYGKYFCPESSLNDIMKRCELIKQYLQCPVDLFVEECIPKYKCFSCKCGNNDEETIHHYELEGILVCGLVLQTVCF